MIDEAVATAFVTQSYIFLNRKIISLSAGTSEYDRLPCQKDLWHFRPFCAEFVAGGAPTESNTETWGGPQPTRGESYDMSTDAGTSPVVAVNGPSSRWIIALFCGFLGISLLPLILTANPPLGDFPNHMARMYIFSNYDSSNFLQSFYIIDFKIIPNLAMDVIIPKLATWMPLNWAGRVFIALIFIITSTGVLALNYALFRTLSIMPLFIFLFLYNSVLTVGLVNYLFGLGAAFWLMAFYVFLRQKNEYFRLLILSAGVAVLFFIHLYSLSIYAVCMLGYELTRQRYLGASWQQMCLEFLKFCIPFVIPAGLFFLFSPLGSNTPEITWLDFRRKLEALSYPINRYNTHVHFLSYIVLASGFGFLVAKKGIFFSPCMRVSLLILSILYIFMPGIVYGIALADKRLIIPIVYLFVASTAIRCERVRDVYGVTIILLCLFLVQSWTNNTHWRFTNTIYSEYIEAIEKMEMGSKLAYAITPNASPLPINLDHMNTLAVTYRDAFVTNLFAHPGGQPLRYTPKYKGIVDAAPHSVDLYVSLQAAAENPTVDELTKLLNTELRQFDYLLVTHLNERFSSLASAGAMEVYRSRNFRLFRLHTRRDPR